MKRSSSLLVELWREVSRHVEIGELGLRVTPLLAEEFPLGLLLVRRIDLQRSCVETLAHGAVGKAASSLATRDEMSNEGMEELLAWCRRGTVLYGPKGRRSAEAARIVPDGLTGDVLAGPLSEEDGPAGILLLVARPGARFEPRHPIAMAALLEPFSVALASDRRLREITALREAAEADKRSLLNRLGRQDISDVIVGAEGGLRQVMHRVDLVAGSDVPVLILGETGSGKEVVARAIHARSRRASGPFMRVNCGAIPPELIDSELFGHERGSFTGAVSMRKGWFERADGGTLFLDEIGELPLAAQVRLLRILQDGSFERVGGQHPLHVNVRIVAATHRDLQAMTRDGGFREDLWYRIAVFPIHLPPLRDHPEDIPALATHFALRAARRFGTAPSVPTPQDVNLLVAYSWPGNVRELATVLERATILGNGKTLEVAKSLGVDARSALSSATAARPAADRSSPEPMLTLDQAMARHIEAALTRTNGRIEGPRGAAALLDINPHTLRARMRNLGVDWRKFREARAK